MTTIQDAHAAAERETTPIGKAIALLNHLPDAINTALATGDRDLASLRTSIQNETAALAHLVSSHEGEHDSPSIALAKTGGQPNTDTSGAAMSSVDTGANPAKPQLKLPLTQDQMRAADDEKNRNTDDAKNRAADDETNRKAKGEAFTYKVDGEEPQEDFANWDRKPEQAQDGAAL
jgi:hypothetical protein